MTFFAAIAIILGKLGNSLVIYNVFTVNHMRSSTNTLIADVAFADFLMTIDIPYMLKWFYVLNKWLGTFMGTVLRKLLHCSLVGSLAVFSLVLISLDCNFAILFPMQKLMTRNVVRFAIAMTWLGALVLCFQL